MTRYLGDKKYFQLSARQSMIDASHYLWSAVMWCASWTWRVRVLYKLTVTMATIHRRQCWLVLRWRTSSFIICILDNSLVRTSIDRHKEMRRSAGPASRIRNNYCFPATPRATDRQLMDEKFIDASSMYFTKIFLFIAFVIIFFSVRLFAFCNSMSSSY